jgi:aryl-alcohol dehydrogenase-like predicted oxidoreductase
MISGRRFIAPFVLVSLPPGRPKRSELPSLSGNRQKLASRVLGGPNSRKRSFEQENFYQNIKLVEKIRALAAKKGCTPAQFALAWVLAQKDDIVPIPGTKRRLYLEENVAALDVRLTPEELAEIDSLLPRGAAAGSRYSEPGMRAVNR